ncbi:unnamed protein product [Microthlaspi erraticum]|uniref:Uncharacterized protein n=1 Tax=Microthlaspi erraticum TaxID=1685480 RepID=A0A6D2JVR0_9BRAS|nr:unnamed protein product [Microthlaspi erraticum]
MGSPSTVCGGRLHARISEETVPDCARLDGIPRRIEMPWRSSARSLAQDGRSGMTEEIVNALKEGVGISDAVRILIPSPDQKPMDAPIRMVLHLQCFLTEFGIRFPVLPLLLEYAYERGIALSQLTHDAVRHMVFSIALAKAAGMRLDRELFEHITDLRAGVKEGNFKRFHTSMKHDIIFERVTPRKVNTTLKEKFRTLRDLSRETWADVVAEAERRKKEKKGKAIVLATPLADKPSNTVKKMGLRKGAPTLVDDDILISDPLSKRRRSDSCEPCSLSRPSESLVAAASGDFSSPVVTASPCRDCDDATELESGDVVGVSEIGARGLVGIDDVFWSTLEHLGREEQGRTWCMDAAQPHTQRTKEEVILKSATTYSTIRSSSSTRPAKLQLDRAEKSTVKPEKCCFPLDFPLTLNLISCI